MASPQRLALDHPPSGGFEQSAKKLEAEAQETEGTSKRARSAAARHDERAQDAKEKLKNL